MAAHHRGGGFVAARFEAKDREVAQRRGVPASFRPVTSR
jgi:hypothetical protein